MRRNARGLRRAIEPPNILATSPYIRAAQTAKIVADTLTISEIEVVEALTPEHHPRDLLTWLLRQDSSSTVGVVGHEPHLGILVTWLISSRAECNVELKKGGVCLLDLGNNPEPGKAVLRWLLTPGQLRSMVD
jgi:phosphohistidine phosphatase